MKTSQYEVEKYRREMFHLLDKHFSENSVVMHRSEHFISRLNLRAANQIEALKAFATAANRAMSLEHNIKTSIHIDGGHVFLFRMDENKMTNNPEKNVLMCITYTFDPFGEKPYHFSDAEKKVTLLRKR